MKRVSIWILMLVICAFCVSRAEAWPWDKKAESTKETKEKTAPATSKKKTAAEATKAKAEQKATLEEEQARKARRALIEQKRKEIDNLEWKVKLTPLSGKGVGLNETIIFRNGQVSFVEFGQKGFNPSNYSVKVQEDNIVVWETMQTSAKSGVVFWRGEINPDFQRMRGIISYQISEKKKEDYSFISSEKRPL